MRVVKVLFLILFFFVCMLFFVQNTQMLATPLELKLEVFSWSMSTTPTPFYVVMLLSFVIGGIFATLYFMAERFRLNGKVKALEGQVASLNRQTGASGSSYASTYPSSADETSGAASDTADENKD
jgi:lipopolysaccharide assembly protein A